MQQNDHVILLHGRMPERIDGVLVADIPICNPNNERNWMGWTKKRLEEKGYLVICPIVPHEWMASYGEWKKELDALTIDEDTILVGLSAGGYVLLRYLEQSGKKVKKLILVAPCSTLEKTDPISLTMLPASFLNEFYTYEITGTAEQQIDRGITIFISDDRELMLKSLEFYKTIMHPKVIQLENFGHFSFLIPQFPELLQEILH
ncbi:hypothetical protein EXS71_00675 [Candidatus Uhrbacteria bacterium]|nr:hypothetical protein [Candidatus Uhrbacteria bacterium]